MTNTESGSTAGRSRRHVELALHAVAFAWGVEAQAMRSAKRGEQAVALARQLVIYVAHVALGVPLRQVALSLGRDRATARHACRVIEDLREQPAFDEHVRGIESALSVIRHEAGLHRLEAAAAALEISR
jgi:chromosomal replication initiation ATPase DnaA